MIIRPIEPTDDLEKLTALIHLAYKRLADMGLRYLATHQSVEVTRQRVSKAQCLVGIVDGRIVGTISYIDRKTTKGCPHYDRDDVGSFEQFAIDPQVQGRGYARQLHDAVVDLAIQDGATELALATSEQATHLIELYEHWGYRFVHFWQWEGLNYRSVIMSKTL